MRIGGLIDEKTGQYYVRRLSDSENWPVRRWALYQPFRCNYDVDCGGYGGAKTKEIMGYFGLIVQKNGGYCESYDGLRGGKYRHTNCEYGEKSKNCWRGKTEEEKKVY